VRLLARTTRSVAPTEAGERLIARLRPALGDIRETLDEVASVKDRPVGRVRLAVPRFATRTELMVKLARFARDYSEVVLDVTTDDSRVDLVSSGFDAGIHIGEYIQRDMIAVRVSPDHRPAIVGSPEYFSSHPVPESPHDLVHHRCVNYRQGSAGVYQWQFEKDDQSLTVAVTGSLITRRPSGDGRGCTQRRRVGIQPAALTALIATPCGTQDCTIGRSASCSQATSRKQRVGRCCWTSSA
jgi:DNA-binding transcriptional LysR family regulator